MRRSMTICFTSDIHGYFSNLDYASGKRIPSGYVNCMRSFPRDGNTLILDGGDVLQGSPLTYWRYSGGADVECFPAKIMNLAGVRFVTLGNHDFNYGVKPLREYLAALDAVCLCANVEGIPEVRKTALVTLENGLRVGLTGILTPYTPHWERPENLTGVRVLDSVSSAREALGELKAQGAEVTVCIAHCGFERDPVTGRPLSNPEENQGYQSCRELDFDILLTGHQHQARAGINLCGTHTCQVSDRARHYARVELALEDTGETSVQSRIVEAGDTPDPAALEYLKPLDAANAVFLDMPLGRLDRALPMQDRLTTALHGSSIANFINQVQLEASGADISVTALGNTVKGFNRQVTIRDIVATYEFPNTLKTVLVTRKALKAALERCAEYFDTGEGLRISEAFLLPAPQHFNYDFYSGIEVTMDIDKPLGQRVVSILYQGQELPEGKQLRLCLNNYRATGAGGYPLYAQCPVLREEPTEIPQLIMDYILRHRDITVDSTQWLHVLGAGQTDARGV